jgi:formate hydrogenlyase subunit 6/NADH:ubiquinone oxidoreductase subunit I
MVLQLEEMCMKLESLMARHLSATIAADGTRVITHKKVKAKWMGTMLSLGWGNHRFGIKVSVLCVACLVCVCVCA